MKTGLLLAVSFFGLTGLPAEPLRSQGLSCGDSSFTIDIRARTVAGVSLDMRADTLAELLGPERISRSVEYLEGEASPLYLLDICGHRLARHWNGLSWRDPVFRTEEGVGVGMPLAAFDSIYGSGKAMWSEAGIVIAYPFDDREFFAMIDEECTTESRTGEPTARSRDCEVLRLWIPFQSLPE